MSYFPCDGPGHLSKILTDACGSDWMEVPETQDTRMIPKTINLQEKFGLFSAHWTPKVVAEMNDYQLKLAKIQGDFVWHKHEETDEVFFVVEGEMAIDFRDGTVTLKAGELVVVPKGVEHKPRAIHECRILLVEPRGVTNTGDAGGGLTACKDVWV